MSLKERERKNHIREKEKKKRVDRVCEGNRTPMIWFHFIISIIWRQKHNPDTKRTN